jgi:hypothetical protein
VSPPAPVGPCVPLGPIVPGVPVGPLVPLSPIAPGAPVAPVSPLGPPVKVPDCPTPLILLLAVLNVIVPTGAPVKLASTGILNWLFEGISNLLVVLVGS